MLSPDLLERQRKVDVKNSCRRGWKTRRYGALITIPLGPPLHDIKTEGMNSVRHPYLSPFLIKC